MSATPETDAFMTRIRGIDGDKHWVPADTAKRLERERDEAREELAHLRACVFDVLHCVKTGAFEELEKAWTK